MNIWCMCTVRCSHALCDGAFRDRGPVQKPCQDRNQRQQPATLRRGQQRRRACSRYDTPQHATDIMWFQSGRLLTQHAWKSSAGVPLTAAAVMHRFFPVLCSPQSSPPPLPTLSFSRRPLPTEHLSFLHLHPPLDAACKGQCPNCKSGLNWTEFI